MRWRCVMVWGAIGGAKASQLAVDRRNIVCSGRRNVVSGTMKVLIVNERLSKRTGTEIVTRDLALGLANRRHEVEVLTGQKGRLAKEVEAAGINVATAVGRIGFSPDVIHFNDLSLAGFVSRAYPDVPALLQWHRSIPKTFTVESTNIKVLCGVNPYLVNRIEHCTARKSDGLLNNYVNLRLFQPPARELPTRPKRWLLVGQQKKGYVLMARLRWVALRHGAELDLVGPRYFRRVDNLPAFTRDYHLVFASGRCALEAACSGAGVIVTDFHGVAGFLRSDNVQRYYEGNFSYGLFGAPPSARSLAKAVADYDPEEARHATRWLRENANIERGLGKITKLYKLAVERNAVETVPWPARQRQALPEMRFHPGRYMPVTT